MLMQASVPIAIVGREKCNDHFFTVMSHESRPRGIAFDCKTENKSNGATMDGSLHRGTYLYLRLLLFCCSPNRIEGCQVDLVLGQV